MFIGVAIIAIVFLNDYQLKLTVLDADYMVYIGISVGTLLIIQSFLGCSGATTQTLCIIIIYIVLMALSTLFCLSFIIASQTSLSDDFVSSYSEHRWESFSNDERKDYESNHGCTGRDECTDEMEDILEKNVRFLNLVCIIVICVQIMMSWIGCTLATKLSKKLSNDSNPI